MLAPRAIRGCVIDITDAAPYILGRSLNRRAKSTTPSKRKRVIDGACSSKFRIHARKKLPRTDCFGPVDDQMANLKITIDRGPAETGAETGRIHVGIFNTPDCSPQSLTALMPDSLVKAPRNRSLPEAAPLGAAFYTPSRTAWFQLNCKTRKEDRATLKLRAMPISSAAWKAAVSIGKTYDVADPRGTLGLASRQN